MTRLLKWKRIFPLVTDVLLAAVLAVPLVAGTLSRSPMAGVLSLLSRPRAAQVATGDWSTFLFDNTRSGFNSSETIINPSTASNLRLHWTHTISDRISAEPIEANGMIYWGSWDGVEHASSLTDGSDVWTAQLGTTTSKCAPVHGVASSATFATEVIGGVSTPVDYVGGGGNATFYALNANTGAVIWQTQLSTQAGAYIWSSPAVVNTTVYVGLSSLNDCPLVQGEVVELDATSGAILHTFSTVPTGCHGASVWSSVAVDTTLGIVYASTGNEGHCSTTETMSDALLALSATDLSLLGSWQIPSSQRIIDGDFGTTPTLFSATIGGISYQMVGLMNKDGIYYAFDRTNISAGPLWQTQMASPNSTENLSSSAWDGTNIYVAASTTTINGTSCPGNLDALNPATGAFVWQDCLTSLPQAPVIAVPGLVEVGFGTNLRIVNSATGMTLFTYHDRTTNSFFYGPASISNGVLYVGNRDGNLYAFGM